LPFIHVRNKYGKGFNKENILPEFIRRGLKPEFEGSSPPPSCKTVQGSARIAGRWRHAAEMLIC
jgi:hypothetical protein